MLAASGDLDGGRRRGWRSCWPCGGRKRGAVLAPEAELAPAAPLQANGAGGSKPASDSDAGVASQRTSTGELQPVVANGV